MKPRRQRMLAVGLPEVADSLAKHAAAKAATAKEQAVTEN